MSRLIAVIPAYNEEKNVKNLIAEWYPTIAGIPGAKMVVVDDGVGTAPFRS